jgi:hypothetical protein
VTQIRGLVLWKGWSGICEGMSYVSLETIFKSSVGFFGNSIRKYNPGLRVSSSMNAVLTPVLQALCKVYINTEESSETTTH